MTGKKKRKGAKEGKKGRGIHRKKKKRRKKTS
jgi:hypothetical protein